MNTDETLGRKLIIDPAGIWQKGSVEKYYKCMTKAIRNKRIRSSRIHLCA